MIKTFSVAACLLLMSFFAAVANNIDLPPSFQVARLQTERLVLGNNHAAVISYVMPKPAAYFSPDNAQRGGITNNALKAPVGANYIPPNTRNSWFQYIEGTTQDTPAYRQSSPTEYLLSNCSSSNCGASSNNRYLAVSDPTLSTPFSFMLSAARSSNFWWKAQSLASVTASGGTEVVPGTPTLYPGIYPWVGSGGTIGAGGRQPSGFVNISATCALTAPVAVDPGFNLISAPTLTVTSYPAGCSGGTITPVITGGYSTGIQTAPGQHWCGVIGQFGDDAVPGGATSGYQFAAFVDQNGNPLSGSPAVVQTVNNSSGSGVTNFFYNSGAIVNQAGVGDIFNLIGAAYYTPNVYQNGWGGSLGPIGMIWGVFPNSASIPSASVLSNLCTKQADPLTYFSANFTVHSFYALNTTAFTDSSPSNYSPLTVIGSVGQSAPNAPGLALTVKDNGPYTTWAVSSIAAASGTISVGGNYNASALGVIPSSIQAQISTTPGGAPINGFSWANITSANIAGGNWSGQILAVPVGGPYYISFRAANATGYVATSSVTQVGLVVGIIGQSQRTVLWGPLAFSPTLEFMTPSAGGSAVAASPLDPGNIGGYSYVPGVGLDNMAYGRIGLRPLTPASSLASNYSATGEGVIALVNTLVTLSGGWPVQLVLFAHAGFASDAWVNGYSSQGPINFSGGTGVGQLYSGTLSFSESKVGISPTPGSVTVAAVVHGQSTRFFVGGVLAATDNQVYSFGGNISTTCVGQNSFVVQSCSINYVTGAANIIFSAMPTLGTVTATWINIVDISASAIVAGSTTTQYDGQDWFGNGDASSGFTSAVMARVPSSFNVMNIEQCSANSGELNATYSSFTPASGQGPYSLSAKWSYVLGTKFPLYFPQFPANTPVLSLGFPRDYEVLADWIQPNNCLKWTQDFGSSTDASLHYSGAGRYGFGGTAIDTVVQQGAGYGSSSPHATTSAFGQARLGRREGVNTWSFLKNSTLAQEPIISGVAFDNTSTYNSLCSATPYSCLNVTVTLNPVAATSGVGSLATCGPNIANGTHPPTGQCSVVTTGANVEGFRIGGSLTQMYFNDGLNPQTSNFNNNATGHGEFACTIVAPTVVQCVKANAAATGAWPHGSTYLSYGDMFYANRSGTLVGTKSGTGYSLISPGYGGTCVGGLGSGTYNVPMTGGTGTAPVVTFSYTVGVGVTSIVPYTPGQLSAGTPIIPAAFTNGATTCSGYNVSPTLGIGAYVNTGVDDDNLVGQYLYDNSGAIPTTELYSVSHGSGNTQAACNPQNGGLPGQCEPGLPVTPVGVATQTPFGPM